MKPSLLARRVFRTLTQTPDEALPELLLSFGFSPREIGVGVQLKTAALELGEAEFVSAMDEQRDPCRLSNYERLLFQLAARDYSGL